MEVHLPVYLDTLSAILFLLTRMLIHICQNVCALQWGHCHQVEKHSLTTWSSHVDSWRHRYRPLYAAIKLHDTQQKRFISRLISSFYIQTNYTQELHTLEEKQLTAEGRFLFHLNDRRSHRITGFLSGLHRVVNSKEPSQYKSKQQKNCKHNLGRFIPCP